MATRHKLLHSVDLDSDPSYMEVMENYPGLSWDNKNMELSGASKEDIMHYLQEFMTQGDLEDAGFDFDTDIEEYDDGVDMSQDDIAAELKGFKKDLQPGKVLTIPTYFENAAEAESVRKIAEGLGLRYKSSVSEEDEDEDGELGHADIYVEMPSENGLQTILQFLQDIGYEGYLEDMEEDDGVNFVLDSWPEDEEETPKAEQIGDKLSDFRLKRVGQKKAQSSGNTLAKHIGSLKF